MCINVYLTQQECCCGKTQTRSPTLYLRNYVIMEKVYDAVGENCYYKLEK